MKSVYDLLVQEIKLLSPDQRKKLFNEFGQVELKPAIVVENIPEPNLVEIQKEALEIAFKPKTSFSLLGAVKYIKDKSRLGLKESKDLFETGYAQYASLNLRIKRSLDHNGWINTVSWLTNNIFHDRMKAVVAVKESIKEYGYEFSLVPEKATFNTELKLVNASSLREALAIAKQLSNKDYKERNYGREGQMILSPFNGLIRNFKVK